MKPSGNIEAFVENENTGTTERKVYRNREFYEYTRVELGDNGGKPGAEWDHVLLRYKVSPEPIVEVGSRDATASTAAPDETRTETATAQRETSQSTIQDTDGDGVTDSEDYAPRDADVQERDDLAETTSGSGSGFGVGPGLAALVLAALARRPRR
ncbi:hypothetical protein BRC83_04565 [Halobacteriales archaeon QS_1_68_17]|nr:MAG: hypothetical protein BRC83_04565 [Halobacteriales archaeon QS_1_68_17]